MQPSAFLNTQRFSGGFSLPPVTPYSLLNLNNLPNISSATPPFVDSQGDKNQIINAQDDTPDCGSIWSIDPRCQNSLQNPSGILNQFLSIDFFKRFGLLLFALILVIFGLYMLARSTGADKVVISTAKLAA